MIRLIQFMVLGKAVGCLGSLIILPFRALFFSLFWILRKIGVNYSEYAGNKQNEEKVWNAQAIIFVALSIFYLIATPGVITSVYNYQDNGWLIRGFLGLGVITVASKIKYAPFLRLSRLRVRKKESNSPFFKNTVDVLINWKDSIIALIVNATFTAALIHLAFYFFYVKTPMIALFITLLLILAFIGLTAFDLISDKKHKKDLDVIGRLEDAIKNHKNGIKVDPTNIPTDIQVAETKPTLKTPKSEPITIPQISRQQHMQILGPTGAGKSMLAGPLAVQDLLNPNVGVIILEPSIDFTRQAKVICDKIGRKSYFINPTTEFTDVLNPLDGDDIDKVAEMNAEAFIGYTGPDAVEFYQKKQANALRMAIRVAKYVKGNDATYDDIAEILRIENRDIRQDYINKIENDSIRKDLEDYANAFKDPSSSNKNEQNYAGLLDYIKDLTANRHMRRILCRKGTISLKEIFDRGEVLLVSTAYGELQGLGSVLGRLVIAMLQAQTFARTVIPDNKRSSLPPIACYVDEVQNYVSEPFGAIFTMARKAKLMMTIIHQDLAQLKKISDNLEKEIFNNARQKVIFGGTDINDCNMFADRIGQYYQTVKSTSGDLIKPMELKVSSQQQLMHKMTGSEIFNLPGFQTDSFEPAEALCLLVEHNRIMPPRIGLIHPIPLHYFEEEEANNTDINEDNISIVATVKDEDHIDLFQEDLDENYGTNDLIQEPEDISLNDECNEPVAEEIAEVDIEESDNINIHKKRRRRRGKKKTNMAVEQPESNLELIVEEDEVKENEEIKGDHFTIDDLIEELEDEQEKIDKKSKSSDEDTKNKKHEETDEFDELLDILDIK